MSTCWKANAAPPAGNKKNGRDVSMSLAGPSSARRVAELVGMHEVGQRVRPSSA